MVRVMVVDDHPMWRDAVERDLQAAGHDVVAVAANGREAIARFPAAAPQVVVLDLQLPDNSGVQVTSMMLEHDPTARVLILSASGEQGDVLEAIKAGATGYLVKSASSAELIDAVVRVAEGEAVFTPGLAGLVLGEFRRIADGPRRQPASTSSPSARPRSSRWSRPGMSYKQIAARLVLSHRTVQNHVQNTLRKLQMNNRVQLTRWAIEHGLDDEPGLRAHSAGSSWATTPVADRGARRGRRATRPAPVSPAARHQPLRPATGCTRARARSGARTTRVSRRERRRVAHVQRGRERQRTPGDRVADARRRRSRR